MSAESEEVNKVTTDKIKNPGRQEAGRKLAQWNKEKKLKEQKEVETEQVVAPRYPVRFYYCLVASAIIIIVAYYRNKSSSIQQEVKSPKPKFSQF